MHDEKIKGIEKRAEVFLDIYQERIGGKIAPPIPVESMAKFFYHLQIKKTELAGNISGKLSIPKILFLNSKDSFTRQRFTIAHEIGHLFLHGRNEKFTVHRKKTNSSLETEVNIFAAALLTPRKLLYKSIIEEFIAIEKRGEEDVKWLLIFFKKKNPNFQGLNKLMHSYFFMNHTGRPENILRANLLISLVHNIAKKFQVSKEALMWRFKNLGLIKEFLSFKPGEKAPISGKYQIIYADGSISREIKRIKRGNLFPSTPRFGQRYVLIDLLKTL